MPLKLDTLVHVRQVHFVISMFYTAAISFAIAACRRKGLRAAGDFLLWCGWPLRQTGSNAYSVRLYDFILIHPRVKACL